MIDTAEIEALLPPGCLFAGKLAVLDRVDSTSTRLKRLAAQGVPAGTVLIAEEQTAGKGTHGRSFQSPRGDGLYFSVLVRPDVPPDSLLTLTGWAAAAVRRAIETACGAPCEIKWLNDVYLHDRKLVGILTEFSLTAESRRADWVVIGVGVNVHQSPETFAEQGLEHIATSLAAEGYLTSRECVCAAVLGELDRMFRAFPAERVAWLAEYRRYCLTLGRAVTFEENGQTLCGTAVGVDDSFALLVDGEDGQRHRVFTSTVTMKSGDPHG